MFNARANTWIIAHLLFNLKAFVVFAADVYTPERCEISSPFIIIYKRPRSLAVKRLIPSSTEEYIDESFPTYGRTHTTVFKRYNVVFA